MGKIKILVVEDEIIIADNICKTLESLNYKVFEPVINYSEAIASIENSKPDICILDIQLSGKKTGIDLAKKINSEYKFPIIFLTANADAETLNKAKEVSPNAYLVKPFSKNELYTSIELAISNYAKKALKVDQKAVFVKEKGGFSKIKFEDILFIKSDHVYVEIVLTNHKKIISRISLNEISEKLDSCFQRIHRGYIINLHYLDKVKQDAVLVSNYDIPIGKKYREDLMKTMNFS
jgi:DNA-binding LytR/AlgR family response regulator